MTFIIAEAGVNHNGDIDMARRLVDAAWSAGADAVKFQTFTASALVTKSGPKADYQINNDGNGTQQQMLSRLELSVEHHIQLIKHCESIGIEFLSTAFGIAEFNMLLDLGIKRIKVPSGEITNLPLLQHFADASAQSQLPVLLSTGMSSLGEVEAALSVFLNAKVARNSVTLLHCLSSYPAPLAEINLCSIQTLAASFKCSVGYSDHTLGIVAPIVAVSLGASVIEKHITLDRSLPGPDHPASLEPTEFTQMVQAVRSAEQMLGNGIKVPMPSEENTRLVARRSIRAGTPIPAGTIIEAHHLSCQRPADGFSPMLLSQVIGAKATRDYQIGDCLGDASFF